MDTEKQDSIPKEEDKKQSFWELVRFLALAIIIVAPIRMYVAQPFVVSGSSMSPTFSTGDYLIVDEISYRISDPERYDVAVFKYPNDIEKFFIKRIIGMPNEIVEIKGNTVTIFNKENPEGFEIEQPYVKWEGNNNIHFELKDNEYFVMGDNRSASSDSRYWGAVSRDLMEGRALVRLLPIQDVSVLPGNYKPIQN
ncbi:MAG: signal peptidase I [Candidatus Pacebacteria bacterium]|nr:signal peptidase I [Candidatus Paceibacterota bacterium]MCF7862827.1 signal peptidase I [Candidatus Paceibacterota bacterium]